MKRAKNLLGLAIHSLPLVSLSLTAVVLAFCVFSYFGTTVDNRYSLVDGIIFSNGTLFVFQIFIIVSVVLIDLYFLSALFFGHSLFQINGAQKTIYAVIITLAPVLTAVGYTLCVGFSLYSRGLTGNLELGSVSMILFSLQLGSYMVLDKRAILFPINESCSLA